MYYEHQRTICSLLIDNLEQIANDPKEMGCYWFKAQTVEKIIFLTSATIFGRH